MKKLFKESQGIDVSLFDVHRKNPKTNGGVYELGNMELLSPREHMALHGNLREREESLSQLKILIDARRQLQKLLNSSNNRLLAYRRGTDDRDSITEKFLESNIYEINLRLKERDKSIVKHLKTMESEYPIIAACKGIKGVGPITIAYLLAYVDINKARNASSIWSYIGYDKASHSRYSKGEAGGGNKSLRTQLYNTADSFIKCRNIYRDVYDNEKTRLEASKIITKTRNTQGKLVELPWCEVKKSHRHGASIRKMMKHFTADFWYVWRDIEGLDTRPLYVEEKLGHKGIIRPEERGWVW
jgi:hypothetical protein